jgi:hypothetical protein
MWKLILATMFFFAVSPLFADLQSYSIDGYTIYDCGVPGSAGYQSCLNAMNLGEAEFMASYTPTGSPLPTNWQDLLPSLALSGDNWNIVAASSDGLSDAVADFDGTDNLVEYIWHDGSFTGVMYSGEELSFGTQAEIYINDQGTVAGSGDCYLFFGSLPGACLVPNGLSLEPPRPILKLNDDNQLLAIGVGINCLETYTDCADLSESILFDPPGAPIPGVPEPASLALLATVVGLVIPLIRKIQADRRAQNSRPIPRASDV